MSVNNNQIISRINQYTLIMKIIRNFIIFDILRISIVINKKKWQPTAGVVDEFKRITQIKF